MHSNLHVYVPYSYPKGDGQTPRSNMDTFIYEGKNKQNNLIFPTFL